jgi:hypothetical protein
VDVDFIEIWVSEGHFTRFGSRGLKLRFGGCSVGFSLRFCGVLGGCRPRVVTLYVKNQGIGGAKRAPPNLDLEYLFTLIRFEKISMYMYRQHFEGES